MLQPHHRIAIYMEENLDSDFGKMGFGVMRFSKNTITCVIDSANAGKTVREVSSLPFDYPVLQDIDQAAQTGANVLVIGIAPSGGRIPDSWLEPLNNAIQLGMSIVNGLHDPLHERLGNNLKSGQWIWDVRQPAFTPAIASAKAASLPNKRILMVGTDMAIGKMTAGLEIWKWIQNQHPNLNPEFLATGQIGITVTGKGIPLDGFKLDHACGAVEALVMGAADADIVIVEGQGSLLHPGSTATLPLMRGACPTHLVMCHRASMTSLRISGKITIPPLKPFIQLNEQVASACGSLTSASTIGIALNTSLLDEANAYQAIEDLEVETGYPVQDVVRFGAGKLASLIVQ
ncbi:MAG: DUF1611 domain-containing protein [Gammaproteobacteria bacterium]|nr:DUF1611 domain-containing protein [Gammaproteobacteria bacterium]